MFNHTYHCVLVYLFTQMYPLFMVLYHVISRKRRRKYFIRYNTCTLSSLVWSGPIRILYLQSGPVRLVRSKKYPQPNFCIFVSATSCIWPEFQKLVHIFNCVSVGAGVARMRGVYPGIVYPAHVSLGMRVSPHIYH